MRTPLILPLEILDIGPRATVTAAALKVRYYAGLANDIQLVLAADSELLLVSGPVAADGFDWYQVYFQGQPEDPGYYSGQGVSFGWVAAGEAGHAPSFLKVGPARCPAVPITVALLGSMTEMARAACVGTASFEVRGMVETCYEGPETSYTYEPAWLWFSCYHVVELGTNVALQMHFPPSVSVPGGLALGDLVRLVGHVNDPAAAGCRALAGDVAPTDLAIAQQVFALSCRSALVLSEIEVTGHIDLPNPFDT